MSDIIRKAHASRSLPFSPMPKDANNLINPKKEVAKKEKKTKQYAKLTEKANKKRGISRCRKHLKKFQATATEKIIE